MALTNRAFNHGGAGVPESPLSSSIVAESGSRLAATTDTYCGGGVSPSVGPSKSRVVCDTLTAGALEEGAAVSVNPFEAVRCAVSFTCTLKLKSPRAVGAPLSVPVKLSKDIPGGNPLTAECSFSDAAAPAPPP